MMTFKNFVFILLATIFSISTAQDLTLPIICSPQLNKCYQYINNASTFWEAEGNCTSFGGHLASISSREENNFVSRIGNYLQPIDGFYWLGGSLSASGWQWTDSTLFNYTNWAVNEPNRNCVTQGPSGQWTSFNSTDMRAYICSVPSLAQNTFPPVTTSIPITTSTNNPSTQCVPSWWFITFLAFSSFFLCSFSDSLS